IKFLKYFTFLDLDTNQEIDKEVEVYPGARAAQKRLAEEMTTMVHNEKALQEAIKISEALFSGDIQSLTKGEIEQGFQDVPTVELTKEDITLVELLVQASISSSKRQAREDISNGAIYINGERNQEVAHTITASDRLEDTFTVVRRGKKKYFLIHFK